MVGGAVDLAGEQKHYSEREGKSERYEQDREAQINEYKKIN